MLPDFNNPSILGRLALYLVLASLTLSGCFVPFIFVFGLFLPVTLAFLAAGFLVVYLPLLDWPWLAWRKTQNLLFVALALAAALVPSIVVPLKINAYLRQRAVLAENGYPIDLKVPASPTPARSILFVEQYGGAYTAACGDYCRALLWSGTTDHVLATTELRGDRLEKAQLFTLEKMNACPGPEFGRERPRDGLCLVQREISNPYFDAILEVSSTGFEKRLTLFAEQGGPGAHTHWINAYDCHELCRKILSVYAVETERLAFPVYPVFAFGIDSGGPFGLRYASRPLVVHPPAEVLKTTFGIEVGAGVNPRPAFTGDVPQGGPLLPTSQYIYALRQRAEQAAAVKADLEYRAKLRAIEEPLETYREKLRLLRQQHSDCASPIISPGPEPKYLGCSQQPPATVPTFSQLQERLGSR